MKLNNFMESSATSKRKLLPFVPDIPYHIQIVFVFTFGYIWCTAFQDYKIWAPEEKPMPEALEEYDKVNVSII